MGGADRKCGKSALWKIWLRLAWLPLNFWTCLGLAWQGCAGSIEGPWLFVGSVGARTTKKKLPSSLASALT